MKKPPYISWRWWLQDLWESLPERIQRHTICRLRGHSWQRRMTGYTCGRCFTYKD